MPPHSGHTTTDLLHADDVRARAVDKGADGVQVFAGVPAD